MPKNPTLRAALKKFETGRSFHDAGQLAEAVRHYGFALALDRDFIDARLCRGVALAESANFTSALADFDAIIASQSAHYLAYNNRGNVLLELGDHALAVENYTAAIQFRPDYLDGFRNRGLALLRMGRLSDAIADFDRALEIAPHLHAIRLDRGVAKLLAGDFATGFQDFESRRLKDDIFPYSAFKGPSPHRSEDLREKTVLVYTDGGYGDVIQFARYLPLLRLAGASVRFAVDSRVHKLLNFARLGVELVDNRGPLGGFDKLLPLLSLPFQLGTTLSDIPRTPTPVAADPERVALWRQRIGPQGLKIGICWQGRKSGIDRGRSLPLSEFWSLTDIAGVRLISLQKNEGSEQLAMLPQVEELGPQFDIGEHGFDDTAAVIECVDLVVSSDTAVAHLSGSMNRPTWVLLQRLPDWRWMMERADSPWYPSMRLYRQTRDRDWSGPMSAVGLDLAALKGSLG